MEPVLGISALQNEKVQLEPQVVEDIRRLHTSSTGKWREHYGRMLKKVGDLPPDDMWKTMFHAFAYPNRSLLLPLMGLEMAEELGLQVLTLESTCEVGGIYWQAMNMMSRCNSVVKPIATNVLYPQFISEEAMGRWNIDLSLKKN
jgi:hypothetical protein